VGAISEEVEYNETVNFKVRELNQIQPSTAVGAPLFQVIRLSERLHLSPGKPAMRPPLGRRFLFHNASNGARSVQLNYPALP
jgi:hypothetical protein